MRITKGIAAIIAVAATTLTTPAYAATPSCKNTTNREDRFIDGTYVLVTMHMTKCESTSTVDHIEVESPARPHRVTRVTVYRYDYLGPTGGFWFWRNARRVWQTTASGNDTATRHDVPVGATVPAALDWDGIVKVQVAVGSKTRTVDLFI